MDKTLVCFGICLLKDMPALFLQGFWYSTSWYQGVNLEVAGSRISGVMVNQAKVPYDPMPLRRFASRSSIFRKLWVDCDPIGWLSTNISRHHFNLFLFFGALTIFTKSHHHDLQPRIFSNANKPCSLYIERCLPSSDNYSKFQTSIGLIMGFDYALV